MRLLVVVKTDELTRSLWGYPQRLMAELTKTMQRMGVYLSNHVKKDKLSGQVLHVRTGTLRRSIHPSVVSGPNEVTLTVGTNLKYGAVHEYGFHGTQNVREHLRMMRQAFGRPVANPRRITVSAHTRHLDLPARSFLRSALVDLEPRILEDVQAASVRALNASV